MAVSFRALTQRPFSTAFTAQNLFQRGRNYCNLTQTWCTPATCKCVENIESKLWKPETSRTTSSMLNNKLKLCEKPLRCNFLTNTDSHRTQTKALSFFEQGMRNLKIPAGVSVGVKQSEKLHEDYLKEVDMLQTNLLDDVEKMRFLYRKELEDDLINIIATREAEELDQNIVDDLGTEDNHPQFKEIAKQALERVLSRIFDTLSNDTPAEIVEYFIPIRDKYLPVLQKNISKKIKKYEDFTEEQLHNALLNVIDEAFNNRLQLCENLSSIEKETSIQKLYDLRDNVIKNIDEKKNLYITELKKVVMSSIAFTEVENAKIGIYDFINQLFLLCEYSTETKTISNDLLQNCGCNIEHLKLVAEEALETMFSEVLCDIEIHQAIIFDDKIIPFLWKAVKTVFFDRIQEQIATKMTTLKGHETYQLRKVLAEEHREWQIKANENRVILENSINQQFE